MRSVLLALVVFLCAALAQGKEKHVVLVVWDGMRPDFVNAEYTPNLCKLAEEGATFRHHHSFYPSLTNVNGAILATGVFPERSGLIGNNEFRPEIDRHEPIDTAVGENILKGDEISQGRYLAVPTIAELVQAAGGRTAIAGTKWVANLFDRARTRSSVAAQKSPRLTAGAALPGEAQRALNDSLGAFPEKQFPNLAQDQWTTAALTKSFWKDGLPAFSLLWLSDPDFTQHEGAPGSPKVLAGIKHSDAMLGQVIDALTANHFREETDILVVSDHGFSTVEHAFELPALLKKAGFEAVSKFEGEAKPGSILVTGNGGTALCYVTGGDEDVTHRLVEWLQQSDFAGVIFSRLKMAGTFTMSEAHLEKKDGPDVIVSFRWNEKPNQFGAPGLIMADAARAEGKGTHATLSKFDLHNILVAAGPDFRRGYSDALPTGNIDVVPTILSILGLASSTSLDGRILSEAMTTREADNLEVKESVESVFRDFSTGKWEQSLRISRVAGKTYFDEGNGSFAATSR